ncbi:MAG: hypothetical protein HYX68_12140 [Planctomycetes bacterium]|nr:hypothetical protein [Planctomycetota bacterium]
MSIVRIGLAETKKFAQGYEAIFGVKKKKAPEDETEGKQDAPKKAAKTGKKKGKK